ncbi:menaquinone-dependent protoporphyrinogen IX dehydrogenase [Snodgrassella sp. CFCC 13594]|uniref:menaquinone-dependent protoporphyrinogen IX dehydrogenase n=1 Tax=Snodgrassella sp. CFCC 13594 TaxID=1775559 RepID=UPI000829E272|nr:menaquinone-dependent protoporphyrinogen IX dehydrogenase [Snodgrassella sp. CFCC 13594]
MNILLMYSSRFGQTQKIAQILESEWSRSGALVTLVDLEEAEKKQIDPAAFDTIVIGASIRYGHYAPVLQHWVDNHIDTLNSTPSAFFSVSILANKPHRNTPETHSYTRKFFEKSAWRPQHIGIFAGELDYRKYHLLDRYLMKFVMWLNKGETDFKAHIEFTDWEKVRHFGQAVLATTNDQPKEISKTN